MSAPPAPSAGVRQAHSVARVLRNTLALAVGRNLIALSRLALLAILARGLGTSVFGQYALLIALLMMAEGLLDFGSNEIFVREVSAQPHRRMHLLRVHAAGRLLHAPLAWGMLVAAALILGYDRPIVEAAAVGGISLLFLGGVMVYRVLFRAELTMEREIVAELLSVIAMLAALIWGARRGWGILEVMACHTASRALYFAAACWLGRREFAFSVSGVTREDLVWSWRACASVGMAGILVMMYDPMDVLLLSRLGGFQDTAHFAAAQRLAWPILITLSAVGGTLYSVAAGAWPQDVPRLERACQRGFDTVVVAGLAAVCAAIAGAEFLLALIGPEMVAGAPAFGILVVLCVVKAISITVGPVLLVVGAQRLVLGIVAVALVFKFVAGLLAIPSFGFVGLAWSALAVECCCVTLPVLTVVALRTGVRLRYGLALLALLAGVMAIVATRVLLGQQGLWPVLLAPALYLVLAVALGVVRPSEIGKFMKSRSAK